MPYPPFGLREIEGERGTKALMSATLERDEAPSWIAAFAAMTINVAAPIFVTPALAGVYVRRPRAARSS